VTTPDLPTPGRRGDLGLALCVGLGLVLAALLLVALPLAGSNPRDVVTLLLWWLVLLYCAARLATMTYHDSRRWAELCFWSFCYVWLGLAGLAQYTAGVNPLWTRIDDHLARTQALVILVGFAAFDAAAVLHSRRPRSGPAREPRPRWVSLRRLALLCLVCLLLTPLFVAVLGGLRGLFASRWDVYTHLVDTGLYNDSGHAVGGLVVTFANALPYVCLLGLVAVVVTDRGRLRDPGILAALVLLLGINVLLNNPISNARYWFFAFVIGTALFLAGRLRARVVPLFLAGYIGMASLAFPYLDSFRVSTGYINAVRPPYAFFLGKTDYGAVTDIGLTIRLAERLGYHGGEQLLGALLFWVPRAAWPDKPANTGYLISVDTNFPNTNLDSPLWAEGFIDFGWVGVLLVLGVFGLLCRAVDAGYLRALRTSTGGRLHWMQLVGPTFAGYLAIIVRGSLLQAMAGIVVLMALLWFLSSRDPARRDPSLARRPPARAAP
jgi:hypothetical protein